MASVSAQDVKALREATGAGMMDCKKVLTEAEGDPARALELLRERGLAKADKRAGRATSEGTIVISIADGSGTMIELGCETDFVANTDDFRGLAQQIADAISKRDGEQDLKSALGLRLGESTVDDSIKAAAGKLGENVELKRVSQLTCDGVLGSYIHAGGRLGVVVALDGAKDAEFNGIARDLAMHIAAVDPTPIAIDREGVPADLVASETSILRKQALQSGKPEKIVDKIVAGRINKFFAEHCLLEQPFVKDPDTSVTKILAAASKDLKVASFIRFKLGEAAL